VRGGIEGLAELGLQSHFGHEIVQCSTDLEHLYRIYSIPTHNKLQWLLLQFIVLLMMDANQFGHGIVQFSTDIEHLYRIYSIPTHDKRQWLLL